jgi:hypothetical protein
VTPRGTVRRAMVGLKDTVEATDDHTVEEALG